MPDYQIKISAVDNATPIVDKAFKKTQASATSVSGKIGDRFRDVFENVTQNATGTFGSVAGGLFKLPGVAGIAAAGVLAAFGTMIAAAKKYAEANAANELQSALFLVGLEKAKSSLSKLADYVGSVAVDAFTGFNLVMGNTVDFQKALALQAKLNNDLIIKQVSETDAFVEKLNQLLDATERLAETEAVRNYFKAFAEGNTQQERFFRDQISRLRTQKIFEKGLADAQKKLSEQPKAANRNDGFKLELESAKRLGESILGTFKAIDEANRNAIKEGFQASLDKLKQDQENFENERRIQRQKLDDAAEYRRQQDETANRQRENAIRVGEAIKNQITGSLINAGFAAKDLQGFIKNILADFIQLGIRFVVGRVLGGVGLPGFANGAILNRIPGAANGMLTRSDSLIRVSERNLPEAIIPLAPSQASRRQELLQQANKISGDIFPNSGATYNMTFTSPVIDINFVRNRLVPMLRELSRQGVRIA